MQSRHSRTVGSNGCVPDTCDWQLKNVFMNMLDNGIWWLPDAECIDRKESCTCYVRYVGVGGYDPAADSANKKSSELRFVESGIYMSLCRVANMDQVRFCINQSGATAGGLSMEIAVSLRATRIPQKVSPRRVSFLACSIWSSGLGG